MALSLQVEQQINSYNLEIVATSDTYTALGINIEVYDEVAEELILELNGTWDPEVYKSGDVYILELNKAYSNLTVTAIPDPENVDELENPNETLVEELNVVVFEHEIQVEWVWSSGDVDNANILVSGITNAGDGFINNVTGWGTGGTKWSDLNGTYIKTDVAVRPLGYDNGNLGMNTPVAGTYNYYLKTPDPAFNGIAYFLAPGNTSGYFSDPENPYVEPSVNFWRLMVGADDPFCYFTNPSTNPNEFPLTGWVLIDDTLDDNEGGQGYDYISGYEGGFEVTSISTVLNPTANYTYSPSLLVLNNNVCPLEGGFEPSITYTLSELVNGVWASLSPITYSLGIGSGWDDNDPDFTNFSLPFTPNGNPIKIETIVRNCNNEVTHSTLTSPGLLTLSDAETLHSESQDPASYTIRFAFQYLDPLEPNLIITPENNARAEAYIYKNNEIIFIYENVLPGLFYAYTFSEASSPNAEYKVVYKAINPDLPLVEDLEVPFVVQEYKPTFDLPTISCVQINQNASIFLQNLNFNCFNADEELHIVPTEPQLDATNTPNIRYSLYYLNPNTYVWELQGTASDTPTLFEDAINFADENAAESDLFVSEYLRTKYYYGSLDTEKGLWAPEKLTMVKLVVAVTNYSVTVTKEVVFPICGTWKIRRMSCGKYRIYNYKNSVLTFEISNYNSTGILKSVEIPPLAFQEITFDKDGIYKVTSDGLIKYIINFCEIENCMLELQKKVLLDDTLCDACKLDKVLYQKALRFISIYETWKKLLDKDWVYEIQYQSTDIDQNLTALYDADELYLELKNLCDDCGDTTKKCNC